MAWLSLAGVVGLGWFAVHRGPAEPARLTADVEARAAQALGRAGFGWARLDVKGRVGELSGEAPSEEARSAAFDAARKALTPYMGLPGVFSELDNRLRVSVPAPTSPPGLQAARSVSAPAAVASGPAPAPVAAVASRSPASRAPSRGAAVPSRDCLNSLGAAVRAGAIRFKPNSADLPAAARPAVRRLTGVIRHCDGWRLVIEGYSDTGSSTTVGRRLEQRRAVAVASALLLEGATVSRLALQTDDHRLETPGDWELPRSPGNGPRVVFHLVPQGTGVE